MLSAGGEQWVSLPDAQVIYRVSRRTLYNWMGAGIVEWAESPSGSRYIKVASLDEMNEALRRLDPANANGAADVIGTDADPVLQNIARSIQRDAELRVVREAPAHPLLKFFRYEHLPEKLRAVSKPFGLLAHQMAKDTPAGAEQTVMLRKLLEAKDCAVRAVIEPEL